MRKFAAEFVAAFFLVFVGVSAIIADQHLAVVLVRNSIGLLGIAIAHGLALAVAIAAVVRISGGHANPAVSVAFFVARRISGRDFAGYIAAQFAGGIFAAFLAKTVFPVAAVTQVAVGVPGLGEQVSVLKGVGIEAALTFLLVFVYWGTLVDRKGPRGLAPMAIGLTATAAILAGGAFTGAALNPARWLGPALIAGKLGNAAVWIAGPIFGALVASLLYEMLFLHDEPDETALAAAASAVDEEDSQTDRSDSPSPVAHPSGPHKPAGEPSAMKPPPPPPRAADVPPAPAPSPAPTPPSEAGPASMAPPAEVPASSAAPPTPPPPAAAPPPPAPQPPAPPAAEETRDLPSGN